MTEKTIIDPHNYWSP